MNWLWGKILGVGSVIGVFLLGWLRLKQVTSQRDRAREQNARADAWLARQEDTRERDSEIDQEFSHRAEEAKDAIKNGQIPDHLAKPRD